MKAKKSPRNPRTISKKYTKYPRKNLAGYRYPAKGLTFSGLVGNPFETKKAKGSSAQPGKKNPDEPNDLPGLYFLIKTRGPGQAHVSKVGSTSLGVVSRVRGAFGKWRRVKEGGS